MFSKMQEQKKEGFETLYNNLRMLFPEITQLKVWTEWDWSNESCEQSVVISKVAEEMVEWGCNDEWEKVERFLIEIEKAFAEADNSVQSYIGTDFLVTVLGVKNKDIREKIKSLMRENTAESYKINLRGYQEPN